MTADDFAREREPRAPGSEERYRVISEMTSDYAYSMVVGVEGNLQLDWVTDAFIRAFGYSIEEINEKNILALVHPDDFERALDELQRILTGEPGVLEMRLVSKSGVVRWLNVYAQPIWDDDHTRIVRLYGAAQDISERKTAEDELETSLQELYNLRAQIELADSAKRLLLDAVVHELRNPLAAVIGFARTLQNEELPTELHPTLIARIVANAEKIDRAISSLIKVARFEDESSVERKAIRLPELLDRVLSGMDFSSHHLEVDVPHETVWVDLGKLEIILDNLLRNALAHTPPGTNIRVLMRIKGGLSILVDDDGPGVSDSEKELVFQPLWRGASTAGGSGLGLYLTARLAEMHGGWAWVQDRRPEGSSFRVWIPQRGIDN